MTVSVVSISLGQSPVFNEDDEITKLAVTTFARYAHHMYEGRQDGSYEDFVGFCHDAYYDLVRTRRFPVVIDELGDTHETTTIFFNAVQACYDQHLIAVLSSLMEMHKRSVVTGVFSVSLRHSPYRIADIVFLVRYLITGPEVPLNESYPGFTC